MKNKTLRRIFGSLLLAGGIAAQAHAGEPPAFTGVHFDPPCFSEGPLYGPPAAVPAVKGAGV